MDESGSQYSYVDHKEIIKNIINLTNKLGEIIKHKSKSGFSDIDLEISGLMHQMFSFSYIVQILYPLEKTYNNIKLNPTNPNNDETVKAQVETMDLTCRKSFLVLTAFTFETILELIIKKHSIPLDKYTSMNQKFMSVIDWFDIDQEEYRNLIKIFYYTRNTLHSGTRITRESDSIKYKGKIFTFKINQANMEYTSWNYFTYFTLQIITIFEKIYKSPKFNNNT